MNRVDDILALIDAGLQGTTEMALDYDNRGLCWRCQRREASAQMDGACEPCASWLVGEGEDPGIPRDDRWDWVPIVSPTDLALLERSLYSEITDRMALIQLWQRFHGDPGFETAASSPRH